MLGPLLKQKAKCVVAIGEARAKIKRQLSRWAGVHYAGTLADAVGDARRCAVAGDTILLSPMCSSFGMFDNYEHRGTVFKSVVREQVRR